MIVRIVNLMGNICLFIPFGFLFPMTFKKVSKLRITFFCGITLSVFIECMQFFVERSSDIDDIILNGIGVIVGWSCYKFLKRITFFRC